MTDFRETKSLLASIGSSIGQADLYERSEYVREDMTSSNMRLSLLRRIWDTDIFGSFPFDSITDNTTDSLVEDGKKLLSIYFSDIIKAVLDIDYGLVTMSNSIDKLLNERIGISQISDETNEIKYTSGKYLVSYHKAIHNLSSFGEDTDFRIHSDYQTWAMHGPQGKTWSAIKPTHLSWSITSLVHNTSAKTITFNLPASIAAGCNLDIDGGLVGLFVSANIGGSETFRITNYIAGENEGDICTITYTDGILGISNGDVFYIGLRDSASRYVSEKFCNDLGLPQYYWMYAASDSGVSLSSITDVINYTNQMLLIYEPIITRLENALGSKEWRGSTLSNKNILEHYEYIRSKITNVLVPVIMGNAYYPGLTECRDDLINFNTYGYIVPADPAIDAISNSDPPYYANPQDAWVPGGLFNFLTNTYSGFSTIFRILLGTDVALKSTIMPGTYEFDTFYGDFILNGYSTTSIGKNAGLYFKIKDLLTYGYVDEFGRLSFIDTLNVLSEQCKSLLAMNTFTNTNITDTTLLTDKIKTNALALQTVNDTFGAAKSYVSDINVATNTIGVPYDNFAIKQNSLISKLNSIAAKLRYLRVTSFGFGDANSFVPSGAVSGSVGSDFGTVLPLSIPYFIQWKMYDDIDGRKLWAPEYEHGFQPTNNRALVVKALQLPANDEDPVQKRDIAEYDIAERELACVKYMNVETSGFGSVSGDYNGLYLKEQRGAEALTRYYKIVSHIIWGEDNIKFGYLYLNPGFGTGDDEDVPQTNSTYSIVTTFPHEFLRSSTSLTPVPQRPAISKHFRILPLNYNNWSEFNDRATHHLRDDKDNYNIDPYFDSTFSLANLQNNSIAINNACIVFNIPSQRAVGDFNAQLLNVYFDQRNLLPLTAQFMQPAGAGGFDHHDSSVWAGIGVDGDDLPSAFHNIKPYRTQIGDNPDSNPYYYKTYLNNALMETYDDSAPSFMTQSLIAEISQTKTWDETYFSPPMSSTSSADDYYRLYDPASAIKFDYLPGNVNVRSDSDNDPADYTLENYPIFSIDHACTINEADNDGYVRSHDPPGKAIGSIIISNNLVYYASIIYPSDGSGETYFSIKKIIDPNLYVQPQFGFVAIAPNGFGTFDTNTTTGGDQKWDSSECYYYLVLADNNDGDPIVRYINLGLVSNICSAESYEINAYQVYAIHLKQSLSITTGNWEFFGLDYNGSSTPILFYDFRRGGFNGYLDDERSFRIWVGIKSIKSGDTDEPNYQIAYSTRQNPFQFSQLLIDLDNVNNTEDNLVPWSMASTKVEIWHDSDGDEFTISDGESGSIDYLESATIKVTVPPGGNQYNGKLAMINDVLVIIKVSQFANSQFIVQNIDPRLRTMSWAVGEKIHILRDLRHYVVPATTFSLSTALSTNITLSSTGTRSAVIIGRNIELSDLMDDGYLGNVPNSLVGCLLVLHNEKGETDSHLITYNSAISAGPDSTMTLNLDSTIDGKFPVEIGDMGKHYKTHCSIFTTFHDGSYNLGHLINNHSHNYPDQSQLLSQFDLYITSNKRIFRLSPTTGFRTTAAGSHGHYFTDDTTFGDSVKDQYEIVGPIITNDDYFDSIEIFNMATARSSTDLDNKLTCNAPCLFAYNLNSGGSAVYELPVFKMVDYTSLINPPANGIHDFIFYVDHEAPASNYPKPYTAITNIFINGNTIDTGIIQHNFQGHTGNFESNIDFDLFSIGSAETQDLLLDHIETEINQLTGDQWDKAKLSSVRKGVANLATKRYGINEVPAADGGITFRANRITERNETAINMTLGDVAVSPYGAQNVASIGVIKRDTNLVHSRTMISKSAGTLKLTAGEAQDIWGYLFVKSNLSELFE